MEDIEIAIDYMKKKIRKIKISKSVIITAIMTVIATLMIWAIGIWLIQPAIFFHPWHDEKSHERLLNEDGVELIEIENDGNILSGWLQKNTKEQEAPLIIFFGGNAQSSSNACATYLDHGTYSHFEGYNFLMVDYPGYGLSDGKPSDTAMFEAALDIYDYAREMESVDEERIVVMGYSIGTGVATYLASQRDVNGLILVAPYDRALSLYNDAFNIFHGPLKALARYEFDSLSYSKNVKVQPLVITSIGDEIISYKFSLNLVNNFAIEPEVLVLDYVSHNHYLDQNTTLRNIHRYLQERIGQYEIVDDEVSEPQASTDINETILSTEPGNE